MLPRMSRAVTDGRFDDVRSEFRSSVLLISAVMVPVSLLLMVLGPAITVPIYAHGATSVADAVYIGNVLQVYGLALLPFAFFQLLLRVFYSFGDTRTPVFVGGAATALNALLMVLFFNLLPARYAVMGLAFAYAVAYTLGAAGAWMLASRRVNGLGGWQIGVALTRMYLAALPDRGGGAGGGLGGSGGFRRTPVPQLADHLGRGRRSGYAALPGGSATGCASPRSTRSLGWSPGG